MFGYVKPLKCELKVREWDYFKAAYCGLCNTLKKQYGFNARFILNYDFTFLAIVLSSSSRTNCQNNFEYKRCIASPFKKKCACVGNQNYDFSAGASVILTWWKLKDSISDSSFFQALPSFFALFFLSRAYKKAQKRYSEFDNLVKKCISELSSIEQANTPSLDIPADTFARILSYLGEYAEDEISKRTLKEMFYHTGRFIYIIDAWDDLKKDITEKNYNPIVWRFNLKDEKLPDDVKRELIITLENSVSAAAAALELTDVGNQKGLLDNILYLGMPMIIKQVSAGVWKKRRKLKDERPI